MLRIEYDEYLLNGFKPTVLDSLKTQLEKARAAVITLIAGGSEICETMLQFYQGIYGLEADLFENLLAEFGGLGLLDVICDCEMEYPDNTSERCLKGKVMTNPNYKLGEGSNGLAIRKAVQAEILEVRNILEL